jgi:hypothetical protein
VYTSHIKDTLERDLRYLKEQQQQSCAIIDCRGCESVRNFHPIPLHSPRSVLRESTRHNYCKRRGKINPWEWKKFRRLLIAGLLAAAAGGVSEATNNRERERESRGGERMKQATFVANVTRCHAHK